MPGLRGGACSVSAQELEGTVAARIWQTLRNEREFLDVTSASGSAASEQAALVGAGNALADRWEPLAAADRVEFISACLSGVIVEADAIRLRITRTGLRDFLLGENRESSGRVGCEATKALAWNEELLSGQAASMAAIAEREAVTQRYVAHLFKLAFLAPDIMTAIIRGNVPADLSLDRLKKGFPLDWAEQRAALGFPAR